MPRRPDLTFEDALNAFLEREGASLLNGVSERNTCARLAIYLENQAHSDGFSDYYADVEYNRKQGNQVKTIVSGDMEVVRITPDLIVHTRGECPGSNDNLIAIEAKKSDRPEQEKQDDRARLIAMTLDPNNGAWNPNETRSEHVCGYALGVFIEINISQRLVHLDFFEKGALTRQKSTPF